MEISVTNQSPTRITLLKIICTAVGVAVSLAIASFSVSAVQAQTGTKPAAVSDRTVNYAVTDYENGKSLGTIGGTAVNGLPVVVSSIVGVVRITPTVNEDGSIHIECDPIGPINVPTEDVTHVSTVPVGQAIALIQSPKYKVIIAASGV